MDEMRESGLIPFASMRLTSPRSKPMFYFKTLDDYLVVMGNAANRMEESRSAQAKTAASITAGDLSNTYDPSQEAAMQDARESFTFLEDKKKSELIYGRVFDALEAGKNIPAAENDLLVEKLIIEMQDQAALGNMRAIESLQASGVRLDSREDIEEYLGEQWQIIFQEVRSLANETENPRQTFISTLRARGKGDIGLSRVREKASGQIDGDAGRQDQARLRSETGSDQTGSGPTIEVAAKRKRRRSPLEKLYQRLPRRAITALEEGVFGEAANVVGRVRQRIKDSEPIPRTADEQLTQNRKIKAEEESALKEWADTSGMLVDGDEFFDKYLEQNEIGGQEHKVVFEGDTVRKANDMEMHATWSSYFERLAITNFLFPETAYELVGFSNLPIAKGLPVTFQPITRQATVPYQIPIGSEAEYDALIISRIDEEMMNLGFYPVTKNPNKYGLLTAERKGGGGHYYNAKLGILISDLHSGNAYITKDNNLSIFDADGIIPDQFQYLGFLKGHLDPDIHQAKASTGTTFTSLTDLTEINRFVNRVHAWNKSAKIPNEWNQSTGKEARLNDVKTNQANPDESKHLSIEIGVDQKTGDRLYAETNRQAAADQDEGLEVIPFLGAFENWKQRQTVAFKDILKHIIKHSDLDNPTKLTKDFALENGQPLSREHLERRVALAKQLLEIENPPLVITSDGNLVEGFRPSDDGQVGAYYSASLHSIVLNEWNTGFNQFDVFIHEAIHANAVLAQMNAPASFRSMEKTFDVTQPIRPEGRFSQKMVSLWLEARNKFDAFDWLFNTIEEYENDTGSLISFHDAALYLTLKHGDIKTGRATTPQELEQQANDRDKIMEFRSWLTRNKITPPPVLKLESGPIAYAKRTLSQGGPFVLSAKEAHNIGVVINRFADEGDVNGAMNIIEYALSNDNEFAAHLNTELFTELLNVMESVDPVSQGRRSLWDRIVQVFVELFNAIEGSVLESALAEYIGFHKANIGQAVKFSPREAVDPLSPTNSQVKQQFTSALQSLATAGVQTQVLETGLNSQLGMYDDRAIQLVIPDLANPTAENVKLLFHEAGHVVFGDMPLNVQDVYHNAIRNLTDSELQVDTERLSQNIAPDNPIDETTQEERLVEAVAKELTEAGFDPSQARSMVQKVLTWLRELYMRAYISIQQALLGSEHVNPNLAKQYFRLRMESFLTNNYSPNAITMMGGAPLTAEQIGKLKRNDRSDVNKVYDFNTGIVELKEIEPETVKDILWNARRRVKFSEDGTVEEMPINPKPDLNRLKVTLDFMQQTYEEMYAMWNEAGLNLDEVSFEEFVKFTLGVRKLPSEKIEELVSNGADADVTLESLEATSARPRAAKQIFISLRKLRSKFQDLADQTVSKKFNKDLIRSQKIADKLKEFQENYTDITNYTKNIIGVIDQALKEYAGETKASRPHIIGRILKKLDPKYKYKNYKSDLEKARKRTLDIEDVLEAIGRMDLDFLDTPYEELAVQIRDQLGETTLGSKVRDNAVIASILGFSKKYPEAMTLLQLRGESNRSRVDQAIRLMMSDNAAGITEARRLLRESITKTKQGERLQQRILKLKSQIRSIFNQQDKVQKRVDAFTIVDPLLIQREEEISSVFEAEAIPERRANWQWEPMDNVTFVIPPSSTATIDQVWAKENWQKLSLSPDEDFGRITKIIQMQTEWLQVNGETGERHALIKRQRDGLMEIQADFTQQQLRQNVFTEILGDRASKMEGIGGPLAKQIARRDRKYVSFMQTYGGNLGQQKGVEWAKAEKAAVEASGAYNLDDFKNRFYNPILAFTNENVEILESYPGNIKAAENEVLRRARIYMAERTNDESEAAWPQLEKLIRLTASRNGIVNQWRQKMGVKVVDEVKIGGEVKKFFRETIGSSMFTTMRRTKDSTEDMYNSMKEAWGNTKMVELSNAIVQTAEDGPEALVDLFAGKFDDMTMEEFVEPILMRPTGAFRMIEDLGGETYDPSEIREAWDATGGMEGESKVVQFAYNLAQLGITKEEQITPAVIEILKVFPKYFGQLKSLYDKKKENTQIGNPVPVHTMMDARVAQNFPSEWMDFSTYTVREMGYYAESLAFEAAYGRDLVGVRRDFDNLISLLSKRATAYKKITTKVNRDPSVSKSKKKRVIAELADAEGGIRLLKNASRDLAVVRTEKSRFESILKNKSEQVDYNASMELVSALTGATVQGMSTAITDMSTALEGPFRKFGLSSFGLSALFKNVKYTSLEAIGTLIQLLPVSWNVNAERVKRRTRLGIVDDDSLMSFRDRYVSNMQDEFRSEGMTGKAMEKISRAVRTVLQSGLGRAKKEDQLYTTLKAAPFSMIVNWQSAGATDSLFDVFTDFIARAGEFFDQNPEAMNDPSYQLNAKDLGLQDRLFGLIQNERAFDYIVNTLQQHGLNPTRLGREWVLNGKQNPLNDEHYRRIASLSATEIMLENTAVTQPSWMMSNKVAMMARPLLRWGFIKTADLAKQLPKLGDKENFNIKDPNTRKALKAYRDFAMAMGMAIIPISLAWAMLRDKYDEEALGKRGNLMRFGEANPFFVMLDRLDRVGTFGMGGEVANTLLNLDTSREFGIDNRVFAINSALSLGRAVGTWIHQGEATYATVYRPALMAMGFGGALQNFQLSNNLLGMDNMESRYTARINVNNILRSTGRQLGLDVRKFAGGGALPTPMKPWLTDMVMSAYANDGIGFRNAYASALQAAEAMGKEDPVKSVKASLTMYHPLRYVYRTPPLAAEFNKILGASGSGRQAINEAITLFNKYAATLGINPYMGKKNKESSSSSFEMPEKLSPMKLDSDYKSLSVDTGSLFPF